MRRAMSVTTLGGPADASCCCCCCCCCCWRVAGLLVGAAAAAAARRAWRGAASVSVLPSRSVSVVALPPSDVSPCASGLLLRSRSLPAAAGADSAAAAASAADTPSAPTPFAAAAAAAVEAVAAVAPGADRAAAVAASTGCAAAAALPHARARPRLRVGCDAPAAAPAAAPASAALLLGPAAAAAASDSCTSAQQCVGAAHVAEHTPTRRILRAHTTSAHQHAHHTRTHARTPQPRSNAAHLVRPKLGPEPPHKHIAGQLPRADDADGAAAAAAAARALDARPPALGRQHCVQVQVAVVCRAGSRRSRHVWAVEHQQGEQLRAVDHRHAATHLAWRAARRRPPASRGGGTRSPPSGAAPPPPPFRGVVVCVYRGWGGGACLCCARSAVMPHVCCWSGCAQAASGPPQSRDAGVLCGAHSLAVAELQGPAGCGVAEVRPHVLQLSHLCARVCVCVGGHMLGGDWCMPHADHRTVGCVSMCACLAV
jgi:hypothetical protein